jgi:hypothetical protein
MVALNIVSEQTYDSVSPGDLTPVVARSASVSDAYGPEGHESGIRSRAAV